MNAGLASVALLATAAAATPTLAGDWYQWRGPEQNGVSREKNLLEEWDPDTGDNVLWKNDKIGGMSSPVVMGGRVYLLTRIGDVPAGGNVQAGPKTQEALACLDAKTGKVLWTHAENMFQTDMPFHRLGWGNPVGDPETGKVYAYGGQGQLYCLDAKTGEEQWKRSMMEEFGFISTFGGRTPSPAIDEDRLYLAGVSLGWGENSRSNYRVFCFDKKTGELLWQNGTGGIPVDAPYQTPVIAVIGGQRLVVTGGGDGTVAAFQARTGKRVWTHKVSQRGLNASVLVEGDRVYAFHSEENLKPGEPMGLAVCLDASGPQPIELWRTSGIEIGFSTPAIHGGKIYGVTNSGRVIALDAKTGEELWRKSAGTIGKASVVWADGKLYIPEANGRFVIMDVAGEKPDVLSKVEIPEEKPGREYAIFGSVAIADGRIFIPTASTLWCIGTKDHKAESDPVPVPVAEEPAAKGAKVAQVVVLPADAVMRPGEALTFRAVAYDEKGRKIGEIKPQWSVGSVEYVAPPKLPPPGAAPGGKPADDRPAGDKPPVAGGEKPSANGAGRANGADGAAAPAAPAALAAASDRPARGGDAAAAGDDGNGDPAGARGEGAAGDAAKAVATAKPEAAPKVMRGNLGGEIAADGTFTAAEGPLQGGSIVAKVGGVEGKAFVRVIPPLPWKIGFTRSKVDGPDPRGMPPLTWINAWWKFHAQDVDGEHMLVKLNEFDLYKAARSYFGSTDMANYTIAADVKVGEKQIAGRAFMPDVGVINSRYVLTLMGNRQLLTLHAWPSELPESLNRTIPYKWKPNTAYRLKFQVQQMKDKAVLRGKVWPAGESEPQKWTVELEDTIPNRSGSPGVFADSLVTPFKGLAFIDNVEVTANEEDAKHAQK